MILVGRLGKNPEVSYTQSGTAKTKFSLATSRRWRDKTDGSSKEKTTWHNIVAWGPLAKTCADHLSKGRQVLIEGEIEYRDYEKDGIKRTFTEINASQVEFLGDGGKREHAGESDAAEPNVSSGAGAAQGQFSQADLDDCPF